jgi:hypothetical protein
MIFRQFFGAIGTGKPKRSLCIGKTDSGFVESHLMRFSLLAAGTVEERMYKKQVGALLSWHLSMNP